MPTGLTSKIYEGEKLTLREFALRCAKHFSPAHSYEGDLPLDKPPLLKGSDYYKLAIKNNSYLIKCYIKIILLLASSILLIKCKF